MKTTGIVRGIDSLGRIVLPKELRTNMHIDKDSKLEIFVEGDQIILKKHRPAGSCDFCGELVADICAGSGTTAVAALNTGRRFLCFETVPAYYAAASERIRVAGAAVEAGEKGV